MLKNEENKGFIDELDAGIKKEVSVSCSSKKATCSICGKDKRQCRCEHVSGKEYKGKTACTILSDISDAYEFSFVAVPAQRQAGVTKAFEFTKENNNMEEKISIDMLINEYQNLYFQEINIDKIIERFRTGEIIKHNGFDYGRFRVFIDSCLLLLNKEKLNDYYKNGYSFKEFIREVENDIHLKDYFEFIKQEPLTNDISNICLFHSFENKKKKPWDQIMTIRKSMAHMQYGNFFSQENGTLILYWLYNKDAGI
jgi:hypothetical protein